MEILEEFEILELLKNDLKHDDFQLNEVSVKSASENPLGLLGDHFKISINVTVSEQNWQKSYFVKRMPMKVPEHMVYAQETRAFYKEIELYKTLFADLKKCQTKAKNCISKWHPQYYYSRGDELLILEDLSSQGYYMYPERCLMDKDHLKASLKSLAAMHSASIIFEECLNKGEGTTDSGKNETGLKAGSKSIGELYSHLTFETEFSGDRGHIGNKFLEAGIASQLKIIELMPDYTPQEKKIISKKLPDVLRRVYQLVKPSERFKNVFIHGDLWANNVLFKKNKNGKVCDAVMIDYQLARFAPPAHDLMILFHLVQDKYFLDANLKELLTFYYEVFSEELEKNSLNVERLFPWDTFLESCEVYKDLGIIIRIFYFQLTLAPADIIGKILYNPEAYRQNMLVDRTDMVVECFLTNETCNRRMSEAMNEVVKRFILNPH